MWGVSMTGPSIPVELRCHRRNVLSNPEALLTLYSGAFMEVT